MTNLFQRCRAFFNAPRRHLTALSLSVLSTIHNRRSTIPSPRALLASVVALALTANIASALSVYPHTLSYFNEPAGGPMNGPAHLLDANVDWGQELLELTRWCDGRPEATPFHLAFASLVGPKFTNSQFERIRPSNADGQLLTSDTGRGSPCGWCAVSVNHCRGYKRFGNQLECHEWLRRLEPASRAGYAFLIFRDVPDNVFLSNPSQVERENR